MSLRKKWITIQLPRSWTSLTSVITNSSNCLFHRRINLAKRKLTVQQRKRVAAIQEQRKQRLLARQEQNIDSIEGAEPLHGLVISRHGRNLDIQDENNKISHCQFRQNLGDIACGDRVVWEKTSNDPNIHEGVVTALIDRTSVLTRSTFSGEEKPLAANITQLIIVLAPQPEPSEYLLDQYLIAAERMGVNAIIAFNKSDLLSNAEHQVLEERFAQYSNIGYELVFISSRNADGLLPLMDKLHKQSSILVGQSGVGKSSLTNALIPELKLETNRLSEKSQLGQHTTSASTLYFLENGGLLIDSPGVRSFRLGDIDRSTLENGFVDLKPYLGHCRFSDCSHTSEPGCALKQALTEGKISALRLDNFLHMLANIQKK